MWRTIHAAASLPDALLSLLTTVGLRLLYAALVLLIGFRLVRRLLRGIERAKWCAKMDPAVAHFILSALRISCRLLIVVSATLILGIPATSFLALLTSVGVAIGLAMQGSLSNLAGGLMILIFRPFRLGDYIETANFGGTVEDITIFYTVLATVDNRLIHCPNGSLSSVPLINYSQRETRRLDVTITVARDADVGAVREKLLGIAHQREGILDTPPATCLAEMKEATIALTLSVWCRSGDYRRVRSDLAEAIDGARAELHLMPPAGVMDIRLVDSEKGKHKDAATDPSL